MTFQSSQSTQRVLSIESGTNGWNGDLRCARIGRVSYLLMSLLNERKRQFTRSSISSSLLFSLLVIGDVILAVHLLMALLLAPSHFTVFINRRQFETQKPSRTITNNTQEFYWHLSIKSSSWPRTATRTAPATSLTGRRRPNLAIDFFGKQLEKRKRWR